MSIKNCGKKKKKGEGISLHKLHYEEVWWTKNIIHYNSAVSESPGEHKESKTWKLRAGCNFPTANLNNAFDTIKGKMKNKIKANKLLYKPNIMLHQQTHDSIQTVPTAVCLSLAFWQQATTVAISYTALYSMYPRVGGCTRQISSLKTTHAFVQ